MAGEITYFYGELNQIPYGYLLCNGQKVSNTVYVELFDAIGYAYGKDDSKEDLFALPNLLGLYLGSTLDVKKSGVLQKGVLQSHKHHMGQTPKGGEHQHIFHRPGPLQYLHKGDSGKQSKYYKCSDFYKDDTYISRWSGEKQGIHKHDVVIHTEGVPGGRLKSLCLMPLIAY